MKKIKTPIIRLEIEHMYIKLTIYIYYMSTHYFIFYNTFLF